LILFQFLVAAYPGNLVAAVYTIATVLGVFMVLRNSGWPDGSTVSMRRALAAILLALAAGALMSLLKWLPPFVEGDWAEAGRSIAIAPPAILTTLVFSYDVSFLPLDLTVRGLWLPLPLLLGILYVRCWDAPAILGVALTAIALLIAFAPPIVNGISLPGLGISRFPVTDWRPTLHLGLILASCAGWRDRLADSRIFCWGDAVFLFCLVGLIGAGLIQGHSPREAGLVLLVGAASLLAVFGRRFAGGRSALTLLLALTAIQGVLYHNQEARSWKRPWSSERESDLFGPDYLGPQAIKDRGDITLDRRPARIAVGHSYDEIIKYRLSSQYNTCFYQGYFCLLGYNNLKMSGPARAMAQAIRDPDNGPAMVDFLMRPQSLVAFNPEDAMKIRDQKWDGPEDQVSGIDGVEVQIIGFANTQVRYRVSVSKPVHFVENEIWASGWTGQVCAVGGSTCERAEMEPALGFLRSWTVPAGSWDVVITFDTPSMKWAWLAFVVGALLAIASIFAPHALKPARDQRISRRIEEVI